MSEQLEILRLKEGIRQVDELNKKQSHSIAELCCLLTDINNELSMAGPNSSKEELVSAYENILGLIKLRATKATNYLYLPKRD